ncbi:MAG: hypothetical protein KDD03_13230, partial [Gelidibacter sp.]|nr:hypothetical protein [Gelidibacter sp.]
MLQDIRTYLLFGSQYCGIEHASQNGAIHLYATLLKKKKKEVDVDRSIEANTIAELANHLPKNTGAFLVVNDENVITKRIESEHREPLKLVQTAFPNLNLNDFIYETLHQKTVHFVSICRRTYIEQLIKDYKKNKISILNVSLGNLMISNVTDFIASTEIYTSNAKVSADAQTLTEIEDV